MTDIMEQLDEELRFEGKVQSFLNGLRAGVGYQREDLTPYECRALDVAAEDFAAEMRDLITCNGERLP